MAIFHLNAKIISRGQGHSAVAAAAYRAGIEMTLEREGVVWDYSKKQGIEHSEIVLPKGAPEWMADRPRLWNAVENGERRKDAQLAREIMVALPVDLADDKQLALLRGYVQEKFVDRGMVADIAIHRDNSENPHAHVMLTMRRVEGDGFGKKCREWNSKHELLAWREGWANAVNHHLGLADHKVQIDHRSLKDQGIDLEPGIHHGATAGRAKGGVEHTLAAARVAKLEQIQRRNAEAIVADPAIALRAITHQRAVFSERDLAKWVSTHTADREDFERVRSAVMNTPELIELEGGRYTSHEMVQAELALIQGAERLDQRVGHRVSGRLVKQALCSRPNLSEEQQAMVRHVLQGRDLAIVEGAAGSGKSWGLQAARVGWESAGFRVHGAALSGRAAQELQESAGINSRSLASWEASWKHGIRELGRQDVLVIDEAGMLGSRQLGRVLAEAEKRGAKVVLVGDTRQIQAIEAGAAMRLLAEHHDKVELVEVHRQRHAWQAEANNEIRHGEVAKGLDAYERMGLLRGHEDKAEAMRAVLDSWHQEARQGKEVLMLAHERVDVAAFNEAARSRLRADGQLGEDHAIKTDEGSLDFATGDRICFRLRNDELGVVNGTLGSVEKIKGHQMVVRLDGEEGRQIVFDTREYNQVEHGFASTLHRAQGRSVEEVVVYGGAYWDRELAYVAMSRQRERVQLHWDRETFRDREHLYAQLGRSAQKVNAQDFAGQEREVGKLAREMEDDGPVIHDSKEVRRFVAGLRERREKAQVREVQNRHVKALEAWQSFKAEHPMQEHTARKDAVEAGRLWRAESETREARIEIEQKYAKAHEFEKKPEVERSPYDRMPAREIMAKTGDLQLVAHRKEMTTKEAFRALPEVRAASEQRNDAKRELGQRRYKKELWEKEHPLKAKMGIGEGGKLAKREQEAQAAHRQALEREGEVAKDERLIKTARKQVSEHNLEIDQAKVELKALKPYIKRAKVELAKEREARQEQKQKLFPGHGLGRGPGGGMGL